MLADALIERYSRQIILPQVGGKGQEKLLASRVLVDVPPAAPSSTDAGPAAVPTRAAVLLYLAAAGVGTVGVTGTADAPPFGQLAEATAPGEAAEDQRVSPLADTLRRLNPDCTVVHATDAPPAALCRGYDVVIAGSAHLHDACHAHRTPFVWGSTSGGASRLFVSRGDRPDWPCLRCAFPAGVPAGETQQSPATTVAGFFTGAVQTTEALKILVGSDANSEPCVTTCDVTNMRFTHEAVTRNPACICCASPSPTVQDRQSKIHNPKSTIKNPPRP